MPRGPRVQVAGAFYHVYARGNRRQAIFVDDEDRRAFLAFLTRAETHAGALRVAHCLMPNHFHLLLYPGAGGLSRLMHRAIGAYAHWFNRRHGTVGHLFQGRYGSRPIESARDLLLVLRYIHLNPVAARLVDHPGAWPWSSHALHMSASPPSPLAAGVTLVRGLLDDGSGPPVSLYEALMTLPMPPRDEVYRRPAPVPTGGGVTASPAAASRPSLDTLLEEVARLHDLSPTDVTRRSKKPEIVSAKRCLARLAANGHGYPLLPIAERLGCTTQAVHRLLRSGPGEGADGAAPARLPTSTGEKVES